jgi:hypothetical protein
MNYVPGSGRRDRSRAACDFVALTLGTPASLQAFQESQDFASSSGESGPAPAGLLFIPRSQLLPRGHRWNTLAIAMFFFWRRRDCSDAGR